MQSDRNVYLSCVEMIVGRIQLCTCSTVDTYSVYSSDVARPHTHYVCIHRLGKIVNKDRIRMDGMRRYFTKVNSPRKHLGVIFN